VLWSCQSPRQASSYLDIHFSSKNLEKRKESLFLQLSSSVPLEDIICAGVTLSLSEEIAVFVLTSAGPLSSQFYPNIVQNALEVGSANCFPLALLARWTSNLQAFQTETARVCACHGIGACSESHYSMDSQCLPFSPMWQGRGHGELCCTYPSSRLIYAHILILIPCDRDELTVRCCSTPTPLG